MSVLGSKSKKSAPGEDALSYKVLGGLHLRAIERLRDICAASLKFGEIPMCWKSATVVLIPKGGKDPGVLVNRRPISLITGMAKVLESIVKEEIQEFVENNKIIPANQFGRVHCKGKSH